MKSHYLARIAVLLLLSASLQAVEYGGEKSHLTEVKYQVCVIPPQVDDAEAKGIKVVSTKKAKELYDDAALFFDARGQRHYTAERIKGAYPVIFDASKAEYIAVQLPSDLEKELVFYCYGESCAASYEAALAVRQKGYENVYWFLNGFPQWKENNYPVEPGE